MLPHSNYILCLYVVPIGNKQILRRLFQKWERRQFQIWVASNHWTFNRLVSFVVLIVVPNTFCHFRLAFSTAIKSLVLCQQKVNKKLQQAVWIFANSSTSVQIVTIRSSEPFSRSIIFHRFHQIFATLVVFYQPGTFFNQIFGPERKSHVSGQCSLVIRTQLSVAARRILNETAEAQHAVYTLPFEADSLLPLVASSEILNRSILDSERLLERWENKLSQVDEDNLERDESFLQILR